MQPSTRVPSFDALKWIGERSPSLQRFLRRGLQPLLHFALMWNMFEGQLCDSSVSVQKLREVAITLAQRRFAASPDAKAFLDFIRTRYFADGRVTERFYSLNLRSEHQRNAVFSVLSGATSDPAEAIFAQLLVVYRYRNNTFHGLKEIAEVFGSQVLFDQAARFLGAVLDAA